MIQSHGSVTAPAIIIQDGGSSEDVSTNYAISGYNEIQIAQILPNGTHLSDLWRTLLIKEKISLRDKEHAYANLVPKYKDFLLEEIKEINPFLLIPIGEVAFQFLTGKESIRRFRGSVMWTRPDLGLPTPKKVLPILGPEPFLNSEYQLRWVSKIDFDKMSRFFNDGPPPEQNLNIWIAKNAEALRNFLNRSYSDDGFLVFDIETFCGIPTCISFCFNGTESVCIPFLDKTIDFDNRAIMMHMVAKVLASKIKKGNQNIKYDWRILKRFGFEVNNVTQDSELAASVLTPELPKNLGFLNSIYTDIPYFKMEGKEFDPGANRREQFYFYNAKDSLSVYQCLEKQNEELTETNQQEVYQNTIKLIPIYLDMENNGLRYDDEARIALLGKYTSLFEIHKLRLHKLTGQYSLNPLSSVQVGTLVYEALGYKRTREAYTTEEEHLEWQQAFGTPTKAMAHGAEILKTVIYCRKIHKVLEYIHTIPYPDGRWRCEYHLGGAKTGRTTAGRNKTERLFVKAIRKKTGEVYFDEEILGRSFQTIAKHGFKIEGEIYGKDLRKMFVPSRGYNFVEIDGSQAEARVDAVLAGNFNMLDVFDGPIGIHRLTGSWLFNCDPMSIKKGTEEYLDAKTGRHAAERNMTAKRLVLMIQKTLAYCHEKLETIHRFQPELREVFHRQVREIVTETRTLVAPNGRVHQFLGKMDSHLHNEAISQLPQCIVGDQTKFSLIDTLQEFPSARMVTEAHDGTLAEILIGREMEYGRIYKKNYEKPINFNRCSLKRDYELVIPVEMEIAVDGGSWYDLKGVKW